MLVSLLAVCALVSVVPADAFDFWNHTVLEGAALDPNAKIMLRPDGTFALYAVIERGAHAGATLTNIHAPTGAVMNSWSAKTKGSYFESRPYYMEDGTSVFLWNNNSFGKSNIVSFGKKGTSHTVLNNYIASYGSMIFPLTAAQNQGHAGVLLRDVGVSPGTLPISWYPGAKNGTYYRIDVNKWAQVGIGGNAVLFENGHSYAFNNSVRRYQLPINPNMPKFTTWKMNNAQGEPCLKYGKHGIRPGPPYNALMDSKGGMYTVCDGRKDNTTYAIWKFSETGKFEWSTPYLPFYGSCTPYIRLSGDESIVVFGLGIWTLHNKELSYTMGAADTKTGMLRFNTTDAMLTRKCARADSSKHCVLEDILADNTVVYKCSGMKYKQFCAVDGVSGKALSGGMDDAFQEHTEISGVDGFDPKGNVISCGTGPGKGGPAVYCAGRPTAGCFKQFRASCFAK